MKLHEIKFSYIDRKELNQMDIRCKQLHKILINDYCINSKDFQIFKGYKEAKGHLVSRAIFEFIPEQCKEINILKRRPRTTKGWQWLAKKTKELDETSNFTLNLRTRTVLWITEHAAGRLSEITTRTGLSQSMLLRAAILNLLSQIDEFDSAFKRTCKEELGEHLKIFERHIENVNDIPHELEKQESQYLDGLKYNLEQKLEHGILFSEYSQLDADYQDLISSWLYSDKIKFEDNTFRPKKDEDIE